MVTVTPCKIDMEPKNRGLEDDFPFQLGDFWVPAVNFQGCIETGRGEHLQVILLFIIRIFGIGRTERKAGTDNQKLIGQREHLLQTLGHA